MWCVLSLTGQSTDTVQKVVENLYPNNIRLKELRFGEIVRRLAIHEGSAIADVGCGPGEISIILSHVVGIQGKVFCEDIGEGKNARTNVDKQNVKNVIVIKGEADDPKLEVSSLDAVLIVNSYHEMPEYASILRHIREALKPDGRLVIVDNAPSRTAKRPRESQTKNHVLSIDFAARELEEAGFELVEREDGFIDDPDSESAQWLIVVKVPASRNPCPGPAW
jgi:precorrin-6B methylase 2